MPRPGPLHLSPTFAAAVVQALADLSGAVRPAAVMQARRDAGDVLLALNGAPLMFRGPVNPASSEAWEGEPDPVVTAALARLPAPYAPPLAFDVVLHNEGEGTPVLYDVAAPDARAAVVEAWRQYRETLPDGELPPRWTAPMVGAATDRDDRVGRPHYADAARQNLFGASHLAVYPPDLLPAE